MECRAANVFDLLPELEKGPKVYDFIILDPPAFTKSRRTIESAMTGYKEINYRAMKLLPRGGYLATCSCSHFASTERFIADAPQRRQRRRGAAAADRGSASRPVTTPSYGA